MFNFKTVIILLITTMLIGCVVYKTHINVPEAKILTNSLNRITHKAEISRDGETWSKTSKQGTSFPIGDGLQVALTHCDVQDFIANRTRFGIYRRDVEVKNRSYWIDDVEIELVARLGDVSIYQKPYEADNPFTMGINPGIGTELLMLGDSFMDGNNWKTGMVSKLKVNKKRVKRDDDFDYCFIHTIPLNLGDSGSPVLARRGGRYEVVGIANAGVLRAQLYNFAIKVSRIKETIQIIGE